MSKVTWVLAVALGLVLAFGVWQHREAQALDAKVARERSDRLAAEARADGWAVTWAEAVPELLAEAAEQDSVIAQLRREARVAGARPVARAVVEATVARDMVLEPEGLRCAEPVREYWKALPFWGALDCTPPNRLGLSVGANITTELIGTVAADGRLLVTARSPDPGVHLQVQTLEWSPPAPPEPPGRWRWLVGAFVAGALVWEMAR